MMVLKMWWMDKSTVELETVFAIVKTWADVSLQALAKTLVFVLKLCLLCAAYLINWIV